MTDDTAPHAGIDLDLIDLSKAGTPSFFQSHFNLNKDKIDYKAFVKSISEKMLENESFLSFSAQIKDVNNILKMKYASTRDIADVISMDGALTTQLLKLVNSSFYDQVPHKTMATISEAMIILGTEEIKLAATTLKIYALLQEMANIKTLKAKTHKALQRSIIARQIALDNGIKDAETIQISTMLYDFGEYLVALFSPEVYIRIELCAEENNLSREQASKSIIGQSYSALGRFVVSKWNLPAAILNAMKPITDFKGVSDRLTIEERQRIICSFSNELCYIDLSLGGDHARKKIEEITENYKNFLNIPPSKSLDLLKYGDTLLIFF
ncbi:HDOD domain-containing protein [Desulfobacula sp.]|uniref:HDOD domain-containing protein n=1 Tax=Desulfobacula sp. TaxID=2593537 RepID=UPI00262B038C|nr:HDOD domain-containing protein [Desulfobacula sp.]